jgi:hypothetical protein
MKVVLISGLFLVFTLAFANAQTTSSMNWKDTTRDVYIDGQIDRDAQILYPDSGQLLVLFTSKLKLAVVIDNDAGTLGVIDKNEFKFATDRASATAADPLPSKNAGKYTKINDTIFNFMVEGKTILINRHEGALGEITEEKLWETVPVWRSLMENYKPSADAIAALKNINEDTQLIVVLGTWCHDSKDQVPRLLKALQVANNKKLHVRLIALDRAFTKGIANLQRYHVTNTPTVIVERNGHEIGRINETPAVPLIEDDLVAILHGKPNVHPGSAEHGAQLAKGIYQYLNRDGKESGIEQWQLYSTSGGGRLVHSEITQGDLRTEIYYETDRKKHPTYVEITIRQGDHLIRERSYNENHKLFSRLAGDSGVLEQTVDFSESSGFSSPAIASSGWAWAPSTEGKTIPTYFALSDFNNIGGFLDNVAYESKGKEAVHTPAGDFKAQRIIQKTKTESRQWYVHPDLGIPVKGDLKDGGSFVLTSIEMSTTIK